MLTRTRSSLLYRLGRKLYTTARLEISKNSIRTNGEADLQKQLITIFNDQRLCFFDIGANVGEWSLSVLNQAASLPLSIHAFEPVEETNTKLKALLSQHAKAKLVRVNQLALSNTTGQQTIYLSGTLAGSNSLHGTPEATHSEEITLTTVDQYCIDNQIDYIHLAKVDTEGHDMFAIEGSLEMLRHNKIAVMQFEYNHRWVFSRRFLKDVFDFIAMYSLYYEVGKLTKSGILIYSDWHYELEKFFEGNYILISKNISSQLKTTACQFNQYNSLV